MKNTPYLQFCLLAMLFYIPGVSAQQVTGIWQGSIDRKNVEVKIIQKGDSLEGTSYYYESRLRYRRFSIKGYFDPSDNSVVWWDDQLLEDRSGPEDKGLMSVADFNCPGGEDLKLKGIASVKYKPNQPQGFVNLTKTTDPYFPDEWDFVIDNYTIGANDPEIIDSVAMITHKKPSQKPEVVVEELPTITETTTVITSPPLIESKQSVSLIADPDVVSIEKKFNTREKVFTTEIPLEGDSIELRFYDNAEIDGDSISLFLNNHVLFTHVRLSGKPYTIKLAVHELQESNELTMVAENLGAIPPNTSFMVAIVGDKRYEAQLASTEQSSAMIKLTRTP